MKAKLTFRNNHCFHPAQYPHYVFKEPHDSFVELCSILRLVMQKVKEWYIQADE